MNVDDLDVSDGIKAALRAQGFVELFPPQAEALPIALSGSNLVVSVPTATGKSLVGYVTALDTVLRKGRKVLYIVPLKALASEKRDDLDKFKDLGISVAMSIGDLDSEDRWLKSADIVVATSEKADSLIRHGNTWIEDVGLVIADEIHMIHDPGRGPTLEVALTKLKRRKSDIQIIALSATISNSEDLAQWLDARLVKSDWRMIPLREGVYFEDEIMFEKGDSREVVHRSDEVWSLVSDTVTSGGQCLVFVNSRRSTESLAVKFSPGMNAMCGNALDDDVKSLIEGGAESTPLGRKLATCVKSGVAFHHAGLTYTQRRIVEESFRNGSIKCIVATPTLAAGINLPARMVVVRDTKRFDSNAGNVPISIMEIKQMCGRAGRPGYDPYGEAVLIAKNIRDKDHLMDDYVRSDAENITSKLGVEKVLRGHILGLIATGDAGTEDEIIEFIRDTFYGSVSELYGIEDLVEKVVDFLVEQDMVDRFESNLFIKPFGKRVSDLYVDPESAVVLRDAVRKVTAETEDFPILLAAACTPDVPGLYPKKADKEILPHMLEEWDEKLISPVPDEFDYEFEFFLSSMKVAALAMDWMNEVDEETITEEMGIGPGDIRSRMDNMEWMLYAMGEIAKIFNMDALMKLKPLSTRVQYGIREELIELISLRGVGRARGRALFNSGFKCKADLMNASQSDLKLIVGPALAKSLIEQVNSKSRPEIQYRREDMEAEMADIREESVQKNLFDF